ncbi:hypothetical protein JZ751_028510, partial [Albula glossodonta]
MRDIPQGSECIKQRKMIEEAQERQPRPWKQGGKKRKRQGGEERGRGKRAEGGERKRLDAMSVGYFRRVSERLEEGFAEEEEKALFVENVLTEVRGRAVLVAMDMTGSITLQRLLALASPAQVGEVLAELGGASGAEFRTVSCDRCGGHVVESALRQVQRWAERPLQEPTDAAEEETEAGHCGMLEAQVLALSRRLALSLMDHVNTCVTNVQASTVLQAMLTVCHRKRPKLCKRLTKGIVGYLSSLNAAPGVSPLLVFMKDQASSRLIETVLQLSHKALLRDLYKNHLQGQLVNLAIHPIANFPVQRLTAASANYKMFLKVFEELMEGLEAILAAGHMGVIIQLADGCAQWEEKQGQLLQCLLEAFHCSSPSSLQPSCLPLFLSLLTHEVYYGEQPAGGDGDTQRPLSKICYHGSRLVQSLAKFSDRSLLLNSLRQLPPSDLLILGTDQSGSHGQYVQLACSRYGSRVLEAVWNSASLSQRQSIAQELVPSESVLRSDQFARHVWAKFALTHFTKRRGQWLEVQTGQSKKRKMFSDILEKRKAVKSCLVCLASYCETHLQPHYESSAFKKHKLVQATGNLQEKICSHHNKLLEVYCRTDQQCICYLCTMDEHRGHDTVSAAAESAEKQFPDYLSLCHSVSSKMAAAGDLLDQDQFTCSVCLDLLKDPVTIPCGHSYCMGCIKDFWNQYDHTGVYSCPQCRQTFTPRPVLGRNTILADMVEKLKKAGLQAAPPAHCYAGPGDVACDVCTGRKRKAVKSCLVCLASYCEAHLQPHYESPPLKKHKLIQATGNLQEKICSHHNKLLEFYCRIDQQCICYLCTMDEHRGHDTVPAAAERAAKQKHLGPTKRKFQQRIQEREKELQDLRQAVQSLTRSAQAAVEDSERIFTELIRSIERRRSEVKELIRDQEKAAVREAEGLLEQLEQEIAELRRRDDELEQLSHTEDHIHFLQSCQSLCALPGCGDLPSITADPHVSFGLVKKSVSELKQRLEDICKVELHNISQKDLRLTLELLNECRQTFTPRPVLGRNTMLAEVVEKLKKTGLQAGPPAHCYAGPGDVACDVCTGRKRKAVKSCLVCLASYCETDLILHDKLNRGKSHNLIEATGNLLEKICSDHGKLLEFYCHTDQQCVCMQCVIDTHCGHATVSAAAERAEKQKQLGETQRKFQQRIQEREKELQDLRQAVQSLTRSAQAAVEDSERIFTELIRSIERRCSEVKELIRDQVKAAVREAEGLLERLEQEIADLRRRDAELEQLSHTEDHIHFLQSCESHCGPPGCGDLPSIAVDP